MLKSLKGLGLSDELLQKVQQSLASSQRSVTSKLRQLAHLDEQLKALKNRIQRQSLAVDRHQEQLGRMQEKQHKRQIEEDKLKEELKTLKIVPPSQNSYHPGTPVAASMRKLLRKWEIPSVLYLRMTMVQGSISLNADSSKRARVEAVPASHLRYHNR